MDKQNIFDYKPIDYSVLYQPVDGHLTSPLDVDKVNVLQVDDIFKPGYELVSDEPRPLDYFNPIQTFQPVSSESSYVGKIVDDMGNPIPYATINSVQNTSIYTESDENGNYQFTVPNNHQIIVRSVGFTPKTVFAQNLGGEIVLTMDAANQLDTVHITATTPTPTPEPPKKDNTLLYVGIGTVSVLALTAILKSNSKLAGAKSIKKTAKKRAKKRLKGKVAKVTI